MTLTRQIGVVALEVYLSLVDPNGEPVQFFSHKLSEQHIALLGGGTRSSSTC